MKDTAFFTTYQQYCVSFKYERKPYTRYCTVPINWQFKNVEKYLRTTFSGKSFTVSKYSHQPIHFLNEREATIEKRDDWNVGLYWRDGMQWEIEMKNEKEYSELVIVTEAYITEKELFKKIKEGYPLVQQISTFYQTECWIKNNNYIC